MKTIVKIEIAILLLVVLVAAGMVLVSEGVLHLFFAPVARQREVPPIPTEAVVEAVQETLPEPMQVPDPAEPRVITATRYFVYDLKEEEYLKKQGDADAKLYPASITKLLTVHTLLQYLKPEDTVTVGDALTLLIEDSTTAGLVEGDTLTVEQLISAMLLPSGNDAALVASVAAGRAVGGKDLDCTQAMTVFVEKMNEAARELGMENSHFTNPDGMPDENHYTTMHDLIILSKAAMKNETILRYTGMAKDGVQLADWTLEWNNTNLLLHESLETYIPGTIGLKTGYTDAAGGCLMSAFFQGDRLLLIGVFGCPGYTMDRYLDTVALYNSI